MSHAKDIEDGTGTGPEVHAVDSSDESFDRRDSEGAAAKQSMGQRFWRTLKTPGSAVQIVIAAVIAIAIGMAVTATVDNIPEAAPVILEIPGQLWLRALRATVLPLIITAIILAVQNLKEMSKGGAKLAKFTVLWYVGTTILAVIHSMILVDVGWRKLMQQVDPASLRDGAETAEEIQEENPDNAPHDIIVQVAESFIPQNVFQALAEDQLLGVLVAAIIVGCLIKGPNSSLLRGIKEVDKIVFKIIDFLIKLAPIGVFFLILANLMTLDIEDIGVNLGVLIGASVGSMFVQLFVVLPALFFGFTRMNPYAYWLKNSPAWITAWGSASSAATLPVTLKCLEKRKVPQTVRKFVAPLGALINMDGTGIYFPIVVVFMAVTQGITLNAGNYTVIVLLAVLSSIATTPIPSSSLVLTVMICGSVGIPVTGMYAVVVAIDWFIDRFRTATNVSGDLYAAKVMEKLTGITDEDSHTLAAQEVLDRTMKENNEGKN
ncbi:uncharacterized protein LTR77_001352 [Saxophila tyrrhenica]|uniref:Amino acid transporter n=1 Tax=Saxophila tyrrhenica TaxID=1690608 RepID=A0AAV9PLV8_9PEZI|nr:hypothetical protein LTR77_001352 [Saxophila tyrrhenica]